MAGFHTETFIQQDQYMTPKYAWENIQHLIPKDKLIWEAFYGDGSSGQHLKELGFDVIHEPVDFFEHNLGEIIVSNPPFSKCKEVMKRLKELEKPFIIILPVSKLNTSYFRKLFKNEKLQLVIPPKRIQFEKVVDGVKLSKLKNACNFDCFYYCYKIGLKNDITWLD
jgi:hypothetical protein